MRTKTKVWLMIAASLVLIGGILFVGVMTTLEWDFTKLATVTYEINTYEIKESFDDISINTDTADIAFVLSDDGGCRVECHEEANIKHSVIVKDGALTVEMMDERSVHGFIGYIGLNFDTPKITVYLPQTEYTTLLIHGDTCDVEIPNDFIFQDVDIFLSTGDVDFYASASEMITIRTSTGDIRVANISAGSLDLTVSTGNTLISDLQCENLISKGNTGDISLNNVVASKTFFIERSTGDVKFDGSDAAEIFVKTDTGDITGSLLTDKIFVTQTDTGDIDIPETANGGRCELVTDTGDIRIEIKT